MKKALKWIVIVVVLLIVGGAFLLYANLDRIIKNTVEAQGSDQLKVPTTLNGVNLSLLGGSVSLDNFKVGSPQGFNAPALMEVGGLTVDTGGISNLRKEPIEVNAIRVDGPKLVIEQQGGKLNFKALMDNLPKGNEPTPATGEKKPVKLIINTLSVNNAHVIVRAGIPGLANEIDLPIPAIDVQNVGNADGAKNGAAIKDVVTTVITAMARKAADNEKLPAPVRAILAGNLDDIKNQAIGVAKQEIEKATGDLTKNLPPDVNNLLNKAAGGQTNGQGARGAADNLLNQGIGALKNATSKPAK